MVENKKTKFLGTTRKIPFQDSAKKIAPQGCLFKFRYRAREATDPSPFIIMISGRWKAKNGKTYFTGVNLNTLNPKKAAEIINAFGTLPVGSVSYSDIKDMGGQDPECCVRTYNVRNVTSLHKVES